MNTWQFTILLLVFLGILILLIKLIYKENFVKVFNIAAHAARVRIIIKSFRFVPVPVITINEKGEIVLANPKTTKEFGWTENELLGKKMDIIIPEEHRETLEKFKILHTGGANPIPDYIQIVAQRKSGDLFPVELTVESWKDEDYFKTPFHTISIKSIKHRKDNEESATKGAKQLIQILELSGMGMDILNAGSWSWDLQSDIIIGDKGFSKIFNLKPWEIVKSQDLMDLVFFEDRKMVLAAMQSGFENKSKYEINYRIPQKDGSKSLVLCIGVPELNKNSRTIKINGIVQLIKENVS